MINPPPTFLAGKEGRPHKPTPTVIIANKLNPTTNPLPTTHRYCLNHGWGWFLINVAQLVGFSDIIFLTTFRLFTDFNFNYFLLADLGKHYQIIWWLVF